ncbi:hypothetical protein PALI_a1491 [Pseudoalteromonas aliena SW19]|uniref:Uncharacterized protein n=1 Tax=Pseudoalteromonas aliena SW19 TaxID=1314866 RepID=A0ABR9DV52_9GAMM|nr:hypothetical protein [Pseudoalteromonas aliena SW19]
MSFLINKNALNMKPKQHENQINDRTYLPILTTGLASFALTS